MSKLTKSGNIAKFETGAIRDSATGKGDMFAMPAAALLRLSKHYEQGSITYGRLNYQKGMPCSRLLDSAKRHIEMYLDGQDNEDHLSAAAWNILAALQMEERNPDCQDIEARKGKKTVFYEDEKGD